MKRTLYVGPIVLASALLLAACGSPRAVSTTTTTSSTTTSTTSTTNTSLPTKNLAVTKAVVKSILDAGAKYHQLPPTDYTGLDPGTAYYAFDPATNTFYAAAGLDPSPHSLKAQVGAQDDGGYNLFVRLANNKDWTVYNDGLGGADGSVCPIAIPASVLAVWNWKPKSCMHPQ
ncbi:MAG: hypothetical protein ABSE75_08540 [Acidimicrobiales bacterium]